MPTLEDFRAEAVTFLHAHAEPRHVPASRPSGGTRWGEGDDAVPLLEQKDPAGEQARVAAARHWMARRFDAGFGWIDGPADLGGRGLSPAHARLYRALEDGYDLPEQSDFFIGVHIVAPTLAVHATGDVKAAYLPRLHRGDLIGCQLFSEPGAGSDLASLATRAVRDGDSWVVTGQKVWTSGAHLADVGEILCRTDPARPRHRGITAFVVDMHAPGVEVRPLRQMSGGAHFNEVFLSDVRIPDGHRLGEVDGGWAVAMTTLMHERAAIGSGHSLLPGPELVDRLSDLAAHLGMLDDPTVRDGLMRLLVAARVNGYTTRRLADAAPPGEPPGPELSLTKLAASGYLRHCAEAAGRLLGPRLAADSGEWGTFSWARFASAVPGVRLAGGTDEILRNLIGERVLGLPREP